MELFARIVGTAAIEHIMHRIEYASVPLQPRTHVTARPRGLAIILGTIKHSSGIKKIA